VPKLILLLVAALLAMPPAGLYGIQQEEPPSELNGTQENPDSEPPKTVGEPPKTVGEPPKTVGDPPKTDSGRSLVLLASGLNMPTGVAVHPETGAILVAESGAGRVVRISDGATEPLIVDFPLAPVGEDSEYLLGPSALLFLAPDTLMVSNRIGGNTDALARVYRLAEDLYPLPFEAAQALISIGPLEDPITTPMMINSIASSSERIYGALMVDGQSGRLIEFDRGEGESVDVRVVADIQQTLESSGPSGIAISPHGYLVVSTLGELSDSPDSVLGFFDAVSKNRILRLDTGLYDVAAVSYSPRKQMYALDLAWSQSSKGGLFRVIADRSSPSGLRTLRIVALEHPTAMAFDSEGAMLITTLGTQDAQGKRQGSLWKVPADENL
jgi:hypothetical protein